MLEVNVLHDFPCLVELHAGVDLFGEGFHLVDGFLFCVAFGKRS